MQNAPGFLHKPELKSKNAESKGFTGALNIPKRKIYAESDDKMVYQEKFYIGFSDVSPDMGALNSTILKLFENVCCMQGEAVGDGFDDTPGRWFLTAYKVKIFDRPRYGDVVTARTWSRGMKGVAASREFEILKDGKLAAAALSNWARLNSETGKLERMSEEAFLRYESEPDRTNFGEMWLSKLRAAPQGGTETAFTVTRNLIDPNRHMNNVRYLDLAAEALPESAQGAEPDSFEIAYRKAFAYGEKGILSWSEDDSAHTVAFLSEDKSEIKAVIRFYKG